MKASNGRGRSYDARRRGGVPKAPVSESLRGLRRSVEAARGRFPTRAWTPEDERHTGCATMSGSEKEREFATDPSTLSFGTFELTSARLAAACTGAVEPTQDEARSEHPTIAFEPAAE